jgi:hypothetical protein
MAGNLNHLCPDPPAARAVLRKTLRGLLPASRIDLALRRQWRANWGKEAGDPRGGLDRLDFIFHLVPPQPPVGHTQNRGDECTPCLRRRCVTSLWVHLTPFHVVNASSFQEVLQRCLVELDSRALISGAAMGRAWADARAGGP